MQTINIPMVVFKLGELFIILWIRFFHFHFHLLLFREQLKEILHLSENTLLEYKFHNKSLQDGSTYRNTEAYVYASKSDLQEVKG